MHSPLLAATLTIDLEDVWGAHMLTNPIGSNTLIYPVTVYCHRGEV